MMRPAEGARDTRRREPPGNARIRAWWRWYGVIVRRLAKLSTDEIVWAWAARVAPNVWRLPGPPPGGEDWLAQAGTLLLPPAATRVPRLADHFPARRPSIGNATIERSRALEAIPPSPDERLFETASPVGDDPPGLFVLTGSGEWWGPEDLAETMLVALRASPAWPYLYPEPRAESGFYFGPPVGQVVRREDVRRLLRLRLRPRSGEEEEPADRLAGSLSRADRERAAAGHLELRNVHASRRKDQRRGPTVTSPGAPRSPSSLAPCSWPASCARDSPMARPSGAGSPGIENSAGRGGGASPGRHARRASGWTRAHPARVGSANSSSTTGGWTG